MFKVDTKGIEELARRFQSAAKKSPAELKRLRSSSQRAAGTEARRAASAVYNVGQGRIGQDLTVSATPEGFVVKAQKKPISALSYGVRAASGGLRLRVMRKGKVTTFRPGFISKRKKLPFYRYEGTRKAQFLAGPSAADMMKNPRVIGPMRERIWGRVRIEFTNRIARLTRKP